MPSRGLDLRLIERDMIVFSFFGFHLDLEKRIGNRFENITFLDIYRIIQEEPLRSEVDSEEGDSLPVVCLDRMEHSPIPSEDKDNPSLE